MELLYIYLDEFKNFSQKAFDLSAEFIFATTVSEGRVIISIKHDPDYIPGFFGADNVVNVSALIGQNGTGKSNLLEFIRESLPYGTGGFKHECCVALKKARSSGNPETYYLFTTPLLKITVKDETGSFQQVELEHRKKSGPLTTNYSIEPLFDTVFINYSNIVDLKVPSSLTRTKLESEEETGTFTGSRNISTMAMLSRDQGDFTNDPKIKVDRLDAYKSREFGRNIEFIASQHKDLLEFPLPEYLFASLIDEDEEQLRKDYDFEWLFDLTDKYNGELNEKNAAKNVLFYGRFLRLAFFNMVRSDLTARGQQFSPEYIQSAKGESFEAFFRNMLGRIMTNTELSKTTDSYLQQKSSALLKLVDFVYEYLIKRGDNNVVVEGDNILALPVAFDGQFAVQTFIDLYIKAKNIIDFIHFKWRSLSSGEQSMLTLVSRFYRLSQQLSDEGNSKPAIIILDEPDIYFHPEWQRTLLTRLLDYLPKLFPRRNLQLIITANTPFLVSDLPPSNVILLKKNGGVLEVHSASVIGKHTFASNIHSLLSEDFYVSNFVGEFAKKRIEELIRYINNDTASSNFFDRQAADKCIKMIGEPVIRNRLRDMFNERFKVTVNDLEARKNELLREISDIDELMREEGPSNA